jgi:two-component system, LytTR family, response regulator
MAVSISIPVRARQSSGIYAWTIGLALIVSLATTGQDYLSSVAQQGRYYFSESLLFSSFWWLFPPLLWLQARHAGRTGNNAVFTRLWWTIGPMAIHLLLYPIIVESIAQLTMGHGFQWINTLRYGISQYGVVLLLGYAIPMLAAVRARNTYENPVPSTAEDGASSTPVIAELQHETAYLDTIMVKEGTRTIILPARDVLLFTAASPYVKVHGAKRQFLVTGTLRSLSSRLDPAQFCRIHKSTIVRLDAVVEMHSRQNGDYDLILIDGSITRMSRSYVPGFRSAIDFQGGQQQYPADLPTA